METRNETRLLVLATVSSARCVCYQEDLVKIVTWNVNSIRTRLERLQSWIASDAPDIVCLQELKCQDSEYPTDEIGALGYHSAIFGQRTYNGVAIISKFPIVDIQRGFPDGWDDAQARLIAGTIGNWRVVSVYVPNGGEMNSDKYQYKLEWLDHFLLYLKTECTPQQPIILCGDYNVAADELDVANLSAWENTSLYNPEVCGRLQHLRDWGLTDMVRKHHPGGRIYTWWDYRQLAFPKNDGLRIDHILASQPLADLSLGARVVRDQRKGVKPSDHAPVEATFDNA